MRVVLTGSAGRIGRAISAALAAHSVVGIDRKPSATTTLIGDIADRSLLSRAMAGADTVVHTAALHAPHVGVVTDRLFEGVNIEGTLAIAEVARAAGVRRIVFTSTTALYGRAIRREACTWIDEQVEPQPETIYHRTKLAAETLLAAQADDRMTVRVLRVSRCFPEPADRMAVYRLHRGVDARDVGRAHALAALDGGAAFERYVISGASPFAREDCARLAQDAPSLLERRAPRLVEAYRQRGWHLPNRIDRVYAATAAGATLGWHPRHGFEEVLAQHDRADPEVQPATARMRVDRE